MSGRTAALHGTCVCLLASVLFAVAMQPAPAHAFSAVEYFSWKAVRAGGDGHYFTGSPADGYTCKVCHEGGAEPPLHIVGMPLAGYAPNTGYEIIVDWPDRVEHMSATVEITDMSGARAGVLRLPPIDELRDSEFCTPPEDSDALPSPAARIVPVPGAGRNESDCTDTDAELPGDCRQVIDVPDCGAGRLRFLWTAPDADLGSVWLAGSAVASDHNGDVQGDGVSDFAHVIPSHGSTHAAARSVRGTCNVFQPRGTRGTTAQGWGWLASAMLVCSYRLRAVRHRKRTPTQSRDRTAPQTAKFVTPMSRSVPEKAMRSAYID